MTLRQRKCICWAYFLTMLVINIVCGWKSIHPRALLFLEIFGIIKNIDKFLTALTHFGPIGILAIAVKKLKINEKVGTFLQLSQEQQLLFSFLNYSTLIMVILVVLPPIAKAFNAMGMASMDKRKMSDAIPCFQIATKLDPTIAEFHYNLGYAYRLLGSHRKEAIEECKAAIRIDSDLAAAYNDLGYLYCEEGKCRDAVDILREARERIGSSPEKEYYRDLVRYKILKNLGRAYLCVEPPQYDQAIAVLSLAIDIEHKYTPWPDWIRAFRPAETHCLLALAFDKTNQTCEWIKTELGYCQDYAVSDTLTDSEKDDDIQILEATKSKLKHCPCQSKR